MKTFFYMSRNLQNKSRVSWKIWKIEREGRLVTVQWGPVKLLKRSVRPSGTLQSKTLRLPNDVAARRDESARILEKLKKGYQQYPRRST
jgi:predicted DNA-binding WGR domain protein